MKRVFIVVLAMTVPFLLFAVAWQSCQYSTLLNHAEKLEEEQKVWMQENKKIITGIAVLESPERIEKVIKELLSVKKLQPEDILKITVGKAKQDG